MKSYQSRAQSSEEKKNFKSTVLFVALTLGAILIIVVIGIPLFGKLTTLVSDLKSSNKSTSVNDTTPPPPPRFDTHSEFTNQQSFSLSGTTEPGATVKLTLNGTSQEALSNKDGVFNFEVRLLNGENNFSAVSIDPAGNISQKTSNITVSFDNKPPEITDVTPPDNSSYFGSSQRQITIQGKTDPVSQIFINDRVITVDDAGAFQYTITLNNGVNQFNIKSTDKAGNTTEKIITLNFTP